MDNSIRTKAKKLTWYAVIIGIVYLAGQHSIYLLGHNIAQAVNITPFLPKIPFLDDAIPVVSIFIIPYIWSYVFWAMGPMAVSKCDHDHYRDFLAACLLSMFAGMVVLIFAPTYMDRIAEGLYEARGNGIFEQIRQFWYSLDGDAMAYNLLPSFHCINSTMCFLGVMGRKELPKWFRVYTFVTMILIFLSTVFVKQHYAADVFTGIILAIAAYAVCKKWHWGRIFMPVVRAYRRRQK